ncbi:hypothetical protein FACS189491_11010 [Spirochaetia bacterium]|nr:hypothetical protein FACS189491_11010 [Spirochaetia bacterium]
MDTVNWIRVSGDLLHIDIKAVPGASKTEAAGVKDKRLRIRLAAAPEDGRANAELCGFLAKFLGCAKKDVVLLRGEKSRLKTMSVPAIYRERVEEMGDREGHTTPTR